MLSLHLATLDARPSWVNTGGVHVDRAVCVEVRASWLWRGCEMRRDRTFAKVSERAKRRGAAARTCREASGELVIMAEEVERWRRRKKPRRLSGDYRTAKANAMKRAWDEDGRGLARRDGRHGGKLQGVGSVSTDDVNLEPNPNAGVMAVKVDGLAWELPLVTLHGEQWRLGHAGGEAEAAALRDWVRAKRREAAGDSCETTNENDAAGSRASVTPSSGVGREGEGDAGLISLAGAKPQAAGRRASVISSSGEGDGRDDGVSPMMSCVLPAPPRGLEGYWSQALRIERWRQHEKLSQHFLICPGCGEKAVSLLLPLCTVFELRDARLAQVWLLGRRREAMGRRGGASSAARSAAADSAFEARLIERYGLLFYPRRFLCRSCLGVRYGVGGRHRR